MPTVHSTALYLEEVFDLGVVVGFLLDERGSVQLTRTKPEHENTLRVIQDTKLRG